MADEKPKRGGRRVNLVADAALQERAAEQETKSTQDGDGRDGGDAQPQDAAGQVEDGRRLSSTLAGRPPAGQDVEQTDGGRRAPANTVDMRPIPDGGSEADKLERVEAARNVGRRSLGGAANQHTHDRAATGRDVTAPGNDAEHPIWSERTVEAPAAEVQVETLANPALAGAPEVEIATRTADRLNAEDDRFRKRYVVLAEAYQPETDTIHARNKVATLNEALNRGLHPRADATFDGAEPHPDGVSIYLDYSVEVVPAIVDGDAPGAVTPRRALRTKYDGSTESRAAQEAEGVHTDADDQ